MSRRVAVVTGGNKGIGLAIVQRMCQEFDGDVILTARHEGRGKEAMAELRALGLNPKFHPLDIDSRESCEKLRDFLQTQYGGLDVLINNAGISNRIEAKSSRGLYDQLTPEERLPKIDVAGPVIATNFHSTLRLCDVVFPILRPGARVVHLTSRGVLFALRKTSDELRQKLTKPEMSGKEIYSWIQQFLDDCKTEEHVAKGWPDNSYGISKWGITRMTEVHQRDFDKDCRHDIVVNCCCPGMISTDMSAHVGESTDVGADTPVYLAMLPPGVSSPRGQFLGERKIIQMNDSTPLKLPEVK